MDIQYDCRDTVFVPLPGSSSGDQCAKDVKKICILSGEWDESRQRIKPAAGHVRQGEYNTMKALGSEVTMQSWTMAETNGGDIVSVFPFYCKGVVLSAQTADFILEAVLKRAPYNFEHPEELGKIARGSDFCILALCVDRASANWKAIEWIWSNQCLQNGL
eukprot:3098644-Pyramimonas_sp.AAC.1